jgi:hypothetical protein
MQWKNEFEELENFISRPQRKEDTKFSEELLQQVHVVKQKIRAIAFGIIKPKHRCIYIQRHQHALIRTWNDLTAKDAETPRTQSIENFHACLEELHSFLQTEFSDCFDFGAVVPVGYLAKVREEFKDEFSGLLAMLIRAKVQDGLLRVVAGRYKDILDGKGEWNYGKVRWLREFVRVLIDVGGDANMGRVVGDATLKHQQRQFYTPLVKQLIYYDYNSIDFKNWLIEAIYEDVDIPDAIYEKIERLSYHLNEMNKMPVREGKSYSLIAKSVKKDVCAILAKELEHLKDKYRLPLVTPVQLKESPGLKATPLKRGISTHNNGDGHELQTHDSEEHDGSQMKIHFGMPVSELGMLLGLMEKVGIIRNEKMTTVTEIIVEHCRTIGRDQIAKKSLYNAISEKDRKTIESLHSKMMDMVNLLAKWKRRYL